MRRLHLVELADLSWLPSVIKDGVVDNLQLGLDLFKPYRVIAPQLVKLIDGMGADTVLDMGSGGAGPWRSLLATLDDLGCTPQVVLSDLQPTPHRVASLGDASGSLQYWPDPTDARDVPAALRQHPVRTMFTALHHLREPEVEGVIAACVRDGVGLGVFEFTERRPREVVLAFVCAFLTTILFAPTMWRGWTPAGVAAWLTRILLSPIIGLVNAWDGAVSVLRTYRPEELERIVDRVPGASGYHWEAGLVRAPGLSSRVLYLTGRPGPAS